MARHRKVTEHRVRSLKPSNKRRTIAEDGLLVEIFPSGKISLYAKYSQAGKQVKEKLGDYPSMSIKQARERVREIQLEANHAATPKRATVTFREFIEGDFSEWMLANRKTGQAAIDRAKHQFYPDLGDRRLKDITSQHIDRYKAQASRNHSPETVKGNITLLKQTFNLAVQWGYLRVSPAVDVKKPTVDTNGTKLYLDKAEFKRLKTAIDRWEFLSMFGTPTEKRYHPQWFVTVIKIMLNTAARPGETLKLHWGDIDTVNRTITFAGTRTKNEKTRRIPISDELVDALKQHTPEEGADEDVPIFPVKSIRKPWSRLQAMSGLDHITPHLMRHHVASTLVLKGAPLSVVRDLLGHHDISVTTRYLSVRTEDKLEALNLL